MSHIENDKWLEAAQQTFEEACENEQWELARDLIADMKDAGFPDQAIVLERELVAKQNEEKVL